MNLRKIGGLVRGHQVSNFFQQGLARGGFWEHFGKSWAKAKAYQESL